MRVLRLYRPLPGGGLSFHEVQQSGNMLWQHWGVAGERGESRSRQLERRESKREAIARIVDPLTAEGFTKRKSHPLAIAYRQSGDRAADLVKRRAVEAELRRLLDWLSLGTLDRGTVRRETFEARALVVDVTIAADAIRRSLAGTSHGDFIALGAPSRDEHLPAQTPTASGPGEPTQSDLFE